MNKSRTPHSFHKISQTTPVYSDGYIVRQAGNIRSISFDAGDARQDRLQRGSAKALDQIFGGARSYAQVNHETMVRAFVDNSLNPLSAIDKDLE